LDSIKDLVQEGNFECSRDGISLQAMDPSHVALVSMLLKKDGFEHYRCDRSINLGIKLEYMVKILKCAHNDDTVTLKADDDGDIVTFIFESQKQDKISDFELKLMNIDTEVLGIPDQDYQTTIHMPSSELQRICRDLSVMGDAVVISTNKEGIKFSVIGDAGSIGSANTLLKPTSAADSKPEDSVTLELNEPVTLTFALRFLNSFNKAASLSPSVSIKMSKDIPLVLEYRIDELGYVRYYLAPKIEDDASSTAS